MVRRGRQLSVLLLTLLLSPFGISAQEDQNWNSTRFHATRQELQELLARFDQAAESGAYSKGLRDRARFEASLIKSRLQEGDFQVGDLISISVDGEPTMSDTLIVTSNGSAVLPFGDTVSLRGVLRSEVQPLLSKAVARIIKNPIVRTESFMRMAVLGAVGNQGYFLVRSDALLMDVLRMAGGAGSDAELKGIRLERGTEKIWDGQTLQEAIAQGRTVDQLSLRAGDRLVVPAKSANSLWSSLTGGRRGALLPISIVLGLLGVNFLGRGLR
jgi:hypothetical protein